MLKRISKEVDSEPFRFSVIEETKAGSVIEISVEDYERDIAAGIPAEELLVPGRHFLKRISPDRVAKREDFLPQNVNVICELRLRLDVLSYLKRLAGSDDLTEVERVLDEKLRPLMEIEDSATASPDEALADKAA